MMIRVMAITYAYDKNNKNNSEIIKDKVKTREITKNK